MANTTLARPRDSLSPPRLSLVGRARAWAWAWARADELPLVLALVALALVAHGLNMFQYPTLDRFDDEGIYLAQAWAVLREFRLAPYTYWYDHAPAGWLLIAVWMGLTGGPHAFGSAVDSGQILALLLHLAMVPLLYRVARKLGGGVAAAALAVTLFSISPLAVYYQRVLLLDVIMLFWVLLSLDLLLDGWGQLSRVTLSGACFGVAMLSKETAVFLIPALLFIAYHQRWRHQGRFALLGWLIPAVIVTSWYPLYALLKGELLPAGQAIRFLIFDIQTGDTVSLTDSLRWQATRGGGGLLNLDNQFWQLVRGDWLPRDALLVAGGALAVGVNLLRGIRNRRALACGLLGLLPLLYLGRGGIVFDFYVLFAIPFLCLNLAMLVDPALRRLPPRLAGGLAVLAAAGLVVGYWLTGASPPLYQAQPGQATREAVAWIKANVPPTSRIVARDGFWTDLREPGFGGPAFPNIHSHWKVAADPGVRGGIFHDNWRRVDYLIVSAGVYDAFAETNNYVALDAMRNSHLLKRWTASGSAIELWKVDTAGATEAALLVGSAAYIAHRFERDGAFVDAEGSVTSEAQAYAMLRAVWSGDRAGFDRAWGWTQAHLVNANGLLAWLWRDGAVADAHSAADADTDAALALLMAGQRWSDPALHEAGVRMARAIWQREVVTVGGTPYLAAGDWAGDGPVVALNPSYFAPYAYRVFQAAVPEHDWQTLIDSGYRVLFDASVAPLGVSRSAGLPPDWVGLDRATSRLAPLALRRDDTTRYSYDAARAYWRVALDWRWSGDGRADAYLRQAGFLRDEVQRKGYASAIYAHDGAIVEEGASLVGTAGALAALLTLQPDLAHGLHADRLVAGAQRRDGQVYWSDPNDLYGQEWAWFATALYADALPNLWTGPTR